MKPDPIPFSDYYAGDPEVASLRIPPHSRESEMSVLGSLLQDNIAFDRVSDKLAEDDFYRSENRLVFGAIVALLRAGKPADVVTVYGHLETDGKGEEAGGLAYLNSLTQYVPSAGNIQRYAEIVRERARLRRLITAGDEIAALGFNPSGSVEDAIDQAQQRILALSEGGKREEDDWESLHDGMVVHTQLIEARERGDVSAWSTGLADLDNYLEGGLRPGELVIVGARPSMGKTALGLTIGLNMAQDHGVALMSMEMSRSEVYDRMTAMLGNVSLSSVKRPSRGDGLAWDAVVEGIDKAKQRRFLVSAQGGLNINQVRTKARNAKRKTGLQVLVLDYIGLMAGLDPKANRNTQLGEVSRGLKSLAKELDICVLCLAQLNRKAEDRGDHMPQMSDLRDSGEIEQDADVILFIQRPIMASPELGVEWQHYAKLMVAKNRQGRCGLVHLGYQGDQTRFTGWAGEPPVKKAEPRSTTRGMQA